MSEQSRCPTCGQRLLPSVEPRELHAIIGEVLTGQAERRPDADPDELDAFIRGVMHLTGDIAWLPGTWEKSVLMFTERGLPVHAQLELLTVATAKPELEQHDWFRYFAGCCWKRIREGT